MRSTFSTDLGIAFDATPALPSTPIDAAGFAALLDAPTAFALSPRNQAPRVSLGDIEVGAVIEAIRRRSATGSAAAWGRAGARLPTGEAPSGGALLDQGTGDHQLDLEVAGVVEVSRRRIGCGVRSAMSDSLGGTFVPGRLPGQASSRPASSRLSGETRATSFW